MGEFSVGVKLGLIFKMWGFGVTTLTAGKQAFCFYFFAKLDDCNNRFRQLHRRSASVGVVR